MKEYLTIGEMARIKKISIKSLRYYERIGILIPEKINPGKRLPVLFKGTAVDCGYD